MITIPEMVRLAQIFKDVREHGAKVFAPNLLFKKVSAVWLGEHPELFDFDLVEALPLEVRESVHPEYELMELDADHYRDWVFDMIEKCSEGQPLYDDVDGYFTAFHVDGRVREIGPLRYKETELFIQGVRRAKEALAKGEPYGKR